MSILKVEFIDIEHFVIYYFCEEIINTEEELKLLFKYLNKRLKKEYHYEFEGFYNVTIYCQKNLYVMEFENVDDFGRADFNITMLLNSILLYEFEDSDLYKGDKIYYQRRYYIELDQIIDDIRLFEYGNIIYGTKVDQILSQGILVNI